MPKSRQSRPPSRAVVDPQEAVPWAIEFANTALSEENWRENLEFWFDVSLHFQEDSADGETGKDLPGKRSPKWHYGGMTPTLAHIHRTQESIRETLETLSDRGTVPRGVVERVNSYLMGLHGFKFHITSEPSPDGDSGDGGTVPPFQDGDSGSSDAPQKETSAASEEETRGKGVQLQTLRLEPKTFDLRSLFYYRFSLFLISASAERVRKCKQCSAFFIQRFNHRKLYCSDLCRFRSHNQARMEKKTATGRKRAPAAPSEGSHVWWRKYEEKSSPD